MIVKDVFYKLLRHKRTSELCSCPIFLLNENKVKLAIFRYLKYRGVDPSILYTQNKT